MEATLRSAVAICLLGSTACGGAEDGRPVAPTVRDSASVRVIEHPGPLPRDAVGVELAWEHGFEDGDYPFQLVFTGAVRSDGSAVVVDAGNGEVVDLDSLGRAYTVMAASGQGPAEVRAPRAILVRGDTTWVEDPGNTKLMRFEGGALASNVNTGVNQTVARSMMPMALTRDGQLLMATSSYMSRFEEAWLDGHVTRVDPETLELDTVAAYPMAARRPETGINPFGPGGFVAGYFDGFAQARTDLPQVTWRDSDGAVLRIVRWSPDRSYPTPELWNQFEEGLRAELRRINPQMPSSRLQDFLDERVADYSLDEDEPLPLFGVVVASRVGDVWLPEHSAIRQRPSRFVVLPASGTDVLDVQFPRPVWLLDVVEGYALGVVEDSLGVQGVAVYRVGG